MEFLKVETEVAKEIHELGLAVKKVIVSYKEATKDGFQAGQDIPAVLMASYQDLTIAIEGITLIDDEAKEAPMKAALGALIPLAEGVDLLLKKSE